MANAWCIAANKVSTIWLNGGEKFGERAGRVMAEIDPSLG